MVSKKKSKVLDEKIKIPGRKTYEEVFDKSTLMVLYNLMSDGVIEIVDHPISTGKEAKVFKGENKEGVPLAIKIMRVNTSVFRKYKEYIEGDHRFEDVGHGRRLIFNWAKKEFANLKRMHEHDIRVPEPVAVSKNVLVMEYLTENGHPAPMLKDVEFDGNGLEIIFDDIVGYCKKLYNEAKMVHGDLSEYNVLISGDYPYLIDVSQSVPLHHPKSDELLKRDIGNIVRYFKENGIESDQDELYDKIVNEPKEKDDEYNKED